jgi:hypothetical protein
MQQAKMLFNEFRAMRQDFNRQWKKAFPHTLPPSPSPSSVVLCGDPILLFGMVIVMAVAVVVLCKKYRLSNPSG